MFVAWRFIKALYPFLREVILGRATLAETYKYDRGRVWVLAIVMGSIVINVLALPRLMVISAELLAARREIVRLAPFEQEVKNLKQERTNPGGKPGSPKIGDDRFMFLQKELDGLAD